VHPPNAQSDHTADEVPRLAYRFRQASKAISAIVASLGLVVLGGWAFNLPSLTYIRPSFQSMKANTALSFLCLGAGLWLAQDDKWQRGRRILGSFVVIIAGLTLAEYAFHASFGIDQLLFRDARTSSLSAYPGRMAIATATCFLLLGVAVTLLGTKKAVALQRSLVGVCFAVSFVALCGYLYGAHSLYSITAYSTVAVHTSAGFLAACFAYFLSQPDQGIVSIAASETNSGLLLRTLAPAIIVVPIVIGWLRLAGQSAGLYDTPFGIALQVIGSLVCLSTVTVLIARSMHRLELERSQAEEARFRHAAIIESSEDAIASGTLDGIIVSWNSGAQRMYGYTQSEAVGKPIAMLVPPELPDEENQILETLRAGGRIEHFETIRVTKTGKRINVSLTISPIKDASGRTVGISGIARDITERKRAEESLHESEERFRLAAHAGRMYAYTWDVTTDVIVRSGDASGLLGSTGEAPLTRQQTQARVHPDDREIFNASVSQHTLGHPDVQISYRMLRPDGSVVWVEKTAHAMFDEQGRMVRVVGMVADITERKKAEETLRESEGRFRLVANTAPVMIWMSGVDKKPTYFNQLWQDFTGLSETDLKNGLSGIVHAEDYQRCHDAYCRGFDQRQPFRKECRLRRYDGQYRWMLDIGVPRFHKDGSFAGYIGSCVDVTNHKLAEEALSGMGRKLVEAQEQERARIARELHDDIGQRLAMLAIDLDQIQQNWPELPPEVLGRMLELRQQTRQISAGVQSLSHDLHSSQLEHLGIVTGIKSWCREFGERQRIQIDFEHDVQGTFSAEIDLCLFRVLQEALHNAAKHSGVKRVKIALTMDLGEIHLLIRDFGKGFDLEAAKRGRGLGLTSMQERVRLVNGMIEIQSKPMDGTAIHVRVPFWSDSNSERAAG
jgi:PAS domain S-box-containing protein